MGLRNLSLTLAAMLWAAAAVYGEEPLQKDTPQAVQKGDLDVAAQPGLRENAEHAVHDSIIDSKPPADSSPQILKDSLVTPRELKTLQDDKPVIVNPPLNDKPFLNEKSLDSILNAKPPADMPPQVLKDILVTPVDVKPLQSDLPAPVNIPPSDKSISNVKSLDSILNAKPPSDKPPQVLKDLLVTPRDLTNGRYIQEDKPLPVNPPPIDASLEWWTVLNAKPPADAPPLLHKDVLDTPELKHEGPVADEKSGQVNPSVEKPVQNVQPVVPAIPQSPAARAAFEEPVQSEELRRRLEDSLVEIKEAIDEASPVLVAAASGGASQVKLENSETEKPAEDKRTYAQVIGHLVEQLLEIPIVFIGAVREALQGLTNSKVSLQLTHPNQHTPISTSSMQ